MRGHARLVVLWRRLRPLAGVPGRPPGAHRLARALGARSRRARAAWAESYNMPVAGGWLWVWAGGKARLVAPWRRLWALAGAPGRFQARSAWLAPWARAPDAHATRGPRVISCPAGGWLWVGRRDAWLVAVRRRLWALAGTPGRPPGAQRLARALGARSRRARDARAQSYNTPVAAGVCEGHARLVALRRRRLASLGRPSAAQRLAQAHTACS